MSESWGAPALRVSNTGQPGDTVRSGFTKASASSVVVTIV